MNGYESVALHINGKDVNVLCDGLLHGAKTFTENWRQELNRNVTEKLSK